MDDLALTHKNIKVWNSKEF